MITLFQQQLPSDNTSPGTSSRKPKTKEGRDQEREEESLNPPPKKKQKKKTGGFRMHHDNAELARMKRGEHSSGEKLRTSQMATIGNHSLHFKEIKSDRSEGPLSAQRL